MDPAAPLPPQTEAAATAAPDATTAIDATTAAADAAAAATDATTAADAATAAADAAAAATDAATAAVTNAAMTDAAVAAAAAMPHHDMSALGLFLQADPVVKGVMLLLALASIACWTVILEKAWTLRRLRREAREMAEVAHGGAKAAAGRAGQGGDSMATLVLSAGLREWREGRDPAESLGEYRDRMERAMRTTVSAELRRAEPGLPLLATTGSVAPFVGLFGTVWGIMNSFSGIAASNDTSLAVVAPGIAEALFATAIGLVAAIPAVIAYNRLSGGLARVRQEAMAAVGEIAGRLARRGPVAEDAAAAPRGRHATAAAAVAAAE